MAYVLPWDIFKKKITLLFDVYFYIVKNTIDDRFRES